MSPATRVLLLAMHGAPPSDFPRPDLQEFFRLHAVFDLGAEADDPRHSRYRGLESRLRAWPRTPDNDPFHAAAQALGRALEVQTGHPVVVAFNEFCGPDLDEGLRHAAGLGAPQVVVLTPMLTPGGDHAEHDIPLAIERARTAFPDIGFHYAWPIPLEATARFLADQLSGSAPSSDPS